MAEWKGHGIWQPQSYWPKLGTLGKPGRECRVQLHIANAQFLRRDHQVLMGCRFRRLSGVVMDARRGTV